MKNQIDDNLISGKGYLTALEESLKEGGKTDSVETIWKNIYNEICKQGQKVIYETTDEMKKFKSSNPEETYTNIVNSLLNLHYDDEDIIKKKKNPFEELEKIKEVGIIVEMDNGKTAENSDKEDFKENSNLKDEDYEILSGMLDIYKNNNKPDNLSSGESEKSITKIKENKKRKLQPKENKGEVNKRIMFENNSKGWKLGDTIMQLKKNFEFKK